MELLKELDHLCIPFKDIELATNSFTTLIGKGGYGNVYKGELTISGNLTTVAVKRLDAIASGQGHKEFLTEIHMLSRFKHSNLVSLLGFCHERNEKILVYEHAEHGSLDKYISMNTTLTCRQKIKICIDAACGLDYLHNHVAENQRVIHRDIKSANILLDHDWKAMISDLGLSKIGRANENDTFLITDACGTYGYCDPVYRDTGVLTKESDVYSLGVVLFEVLCGRFCFMNVNDERRFLPSLVRQYYQKGKLQEIIDPVMKENLPSGSLIMISEIACQCLHNVRKERPSMGLVVKKLKEALEVLDMKVVGETDVFWLNDDIKSLVRRLTHQTEMFVPIVGEGGSGKTTLARAVYENRKIKNHFEFQSWISVTREYTAEDITSIGLESMNTVKGKRYLIVVDGVESYGVLRDLKDSFPDEKNGSKVLFTSRSIPETVALNLHIMNRLNEEKSWKMFLHKVGKEKEADRITAWLKHSILSICNGLRQNIVLMVGLLSNCEIERWSVKIGNGQHPGDVIRICYKDLTSDSKLFLLHLALFPKDYNISVWRLLSLWPAEDGLPDYSPKLKCFEKLVGRNIIQITKLRSDNSPKLCRLVSSFHDYLLHTVLGETFSSDFALLLNYKYEGLTRVFLEFFPELNLTIPPNNFSALETPDLQLSIPPNNFSALETPNSTLMLKELHHYLSMKNIGITITLDTYKRQNSFLELENMRLEKMRFIYIPSRTPPKTVPYLNSFWTLKQLNLNNIRVTMPLNSCLTVAIIKGLFLVDKIPINKLEGVLMLINLKESGIEFQLNTRIQDALLDLIKKQSQQLILQPTMRK